MNDSALRYRLYQVLIETDLTQSQRDHLMEGWVDNLKAFAGAIKDTANVDVGKIFADAKFKRRVKVAGDNITKELQGLKDVAKTANVPEEVVMGMLNSILKGSGITPKDIASGTAAAKSGNVDSDSSGGEKAAAPASGTAIDPSTPSAVPALAAAAGQLAGQNPEKAQKDAASKNVDAPKATDILSKMVSKQSKVDSEKTKSIIDFLLKNKLLVAEGRLAYSVDLMKASQEISKVLEEMSVLDRWGDLALLTEAPKPPKPGAKPAKPAAAKPAAGKKPAAKPAAGKTTAQPTTQQPAAQPASGKDASQDKQAQPAGTAAQKKDDKATDEVPEDAKKFTGLIDKIVGRIKNVKKSEIAAVLSALDGTGSLEVKAA